MLHTIVKAIEDMVMATKKYLQEVGADGHIILKPDYLVDMGFDKNMVENNVRLFDENMDETLSEGTRGVWGLNFLYAIAKEFSVDTTQARLNIGKGFQAQELVKAIKATIL